MHKVFIYPSMAEKETCRAKIRKGLVSTWCVEPLTIVALKIVNTTRELTMLCHKAKEEFYSFGSILKRGFKLRINRNKLSHFVLFFIVNLLTRQEMIKRKNRKLGRS